jgi:hypothetical protein
VTERPSTQQFEENVSSYNKLAAKLCDTRWQVYLSAVTAILLSYARTIATDGIGLPFESPSAFQTFLFGVGSICAIIAPLTFGLLLQQGQSASREKLALYERYQNLVIELRKYLKDLYDNKGVSNQYTEFLGSLEITQSSDFDEPGTFHWWQWAAIGLIRWLEDAAAADNQPDVDFDEVHHGLMPQLLVIEQLLHAVQINAIRRAVINLVLINPVINLFWMIVSVLVLAVLSSVHYTGAAPFLYFFGATFVSTFIVLTIFQLGRYARFEARAVMRER